MVCQDVGPLLTVPQEPSSTRPMSHNPGETGLGLLVFLFREDLAWLFGHDCSYWSRVKNDLDMAGSKLRWHGGRKNNGLECYSEQLPVVKWIASIPLIIFCVLYAKIIMVVGVWQ